MTSSNFPLSILNILRAKNPFADNAAANPWSSLFPDVLSINSKPFEEITRLISAKAVNPEQPLAGLIIGETGMGKTHLMRRILDQCRNSETTKLFVFVKPLFDPNKPIQHLLQEIVLNLSKKTSNKHSFSQFERLVAEMMRDYVRYRVTNNAADNTPNNRCFLEQFESDVFHIFTNQKKVRGKGMEIIAREAVNYIHSQVPETNKIFLNVIFQYKTPEKRGLVRDWIKGGTLSEDDCEILGVKSRANLSEKALEGEARDMLSSLGVLFQRYRLTMVICFDQLDNINDSELIAGFASMIHLLVNDLSSMLPLAFIRADIWNERFKKYTDRAFSDRLECNKIPLSNCTNEQAKELVVARLDTVFPNENKNKEEELVKNRLLEQFDTKLKGELSPREVIYLANCIVRESDSVPVWLRTHSEILAAEYKIAQDNVTENFDTWDPESEYLKKALELWLRNQKFVSEIKEEKGKYTSWTGYFVPTSNGVTDKEISEKIPFGFFINTSKNWSVVSAVLRRAIEFLNKNPNGQCVYIADQRCNFSPKWKANELRETFERLGGIFLILDQITVIYWYGLVALFWKIVNGDIVFETEQDLNTATEKDFVVFLSDQFEAFESQAGFDRLFKTSNNNAKK
ncbi:MAG: ATP-binding protein [Planctomycetaceae bacterium]|jgi:type II secretory pathway predicted ATPase ExeA|nr:ATP-binding protein [Planctomycetaceae bacterium]